MKIAIDQEKSFAHDKCHIYESRFLTRTSSQVGKDATLIELLFILWVKPTENDWKGALCVDKMCGDDNVFKLTNSLFLCLHWNQNT